MSAQLDLFAAEPPVSAADLKWERHYGKWDAICGLPLRGPKSYASRISGARREAYEEGYRAALEIPR